MGKQVSKNKEQVPAAVSDYGTYAGGGYENTNQDDFARPVVVLLQALSPQVSGTDPIDGARAGSLLNSATDELYPEEGFIFVPCAREHVFTEWIPKNEDGTGGGFVGRHEPASEVVAAAIKQYGRFGKPKLPNGNELVETFYLYGMVLENASDTEAIDIVVIPFTSTKIKKYKAWMTKSRTVKGRPPMFAHRVQVSTVGERKGNHNFFNYKLEPALGKSIKESLIPPELDGAPHPLLIEGDNISRMVSEGKMSINEAQVSDDPPHTETAGDAGDCETPPF